MDCYEVAILNVKHAKPISDSEFVLQCVMKIAENVCPDKKHLRMFVLHATLLQKYYLTSEAK